MGPTFRRKARAFSHFKEFQGLSEETLRRATDILEKLPKETAKRAETAYTLSISILYIASIETNPLEQIFSCARFTQDPGLIPILLGCKRRANPDAVRNMVRILLEMK